MALLLIGAGIIMLLEWGWDQYFHSGEPIRRRSLGGGVFALMLLFGITGIVFSGIHNGGFGRHFNINPDNMDEFLGDKHESDQTLAQAFTDGNTLTIDNPRGDVNVSGTSDDNQIHVEVHKQVYTRSDSDADSKAQQLSPKARTPKARTSKSRVPPSKAAAPISPSPSLPPRAVTVISNRGDVRIAAVKGACLRHRQPRRCHLHRHHRPGQRPHQQRRLLLLRPRRHRPRLRSRATPATSPSPRSPAPPP